MAAAVPVVVAVAVVAVAVVVEVVVVEVSAVVSVAACHRGSPRLHESQPAKVALLAADGRQVGERAEVGGVVERVGQQPQLGRLDDARLARGRRGEGGGKSSRGHGLSC